MNSGPSLSFIPKSKRTEIVCLEHLLADPLNIYEIPDKIRKKIVTPKLALSIIQYQFHLIQYLPRKVLNKAFMEIIWSLRNEINFDIIFFLKFCPRTLLSRKFCQECFSFYPKKEVLGLFPKSVVTRTLLEIGFRINPTLIKDIDQTKLNRKLAVMVIREYGLGLKYITEKYVDRQTSRLGILADPRANKYAKFRPIQN